MPTPLALLRHRRTCAVLSSGVLAACVGCGSGTASADHAARAVTHSHLPPAPPRHAAAASATCAQTVTDTLTRIAERVYGQAAVGRGVVSAQRRLARSHALAVAVAAQDAAATRTALRPLLKHQIVRIDVSGRSGRLASFGHTNALAPTEGAIVLGGREVGRYRMAVGSDAAIAGLTSSLLGGPVAMREGSRTIQQVGGPLPAGPVAGGPVRVGGRTYTAVSFPATRFPSGPMRVWVLLPPTPRGACRASAPATAAAAIGLVGERLFAAERTGSAVRRVLRHVATDAGFQRAVATDDAAALRTAIVRFFRTRSLHVVRIRATLPDGRLVNDVGGPYVLAPASRTIVTPGGRVLGRVTLSIQDDTGYIKLMHRFTGAAVQLRTPAGQVPGSTLAPGPRAIPTRGALAVAGRGYQAFSFPARAFPSGPLRISLLVPDRR